MQTENASESTVDLTSSTPIPQPYSLVALHRDQPGSAMWFEYAMTRIEKMSALFGGNATLLKSQVWELYAKASPLLGLWLAFKGDQPVGHALAQIQSWDGRLVGWVNQSEIDRATGAVLKHVLVNALEAWVHTVNRHLKQANQPLVRELLMVTRRGTAKNFDHWSRHSGFDPYLTVYRREIQGVE